ncbi:unnamed protein product [Phaeothamnion confervicola]
MTNHVSLVDRLRIERAVWTLDQRLYDLPRRVRIAHRRDVRANLLAAASDVGTRTALANLGDQRRLADEYLTAEFGDGPRASLIAAAVFFLTAQLLFTSMLSEAANAFGAGIRAANPDATGTFSWHGVPYLQDRVTFTLTNGIGDSVGGAWTPLAYVLWVIATILVGRLWRLPAMWRRRRALAATVATTS